MRIFLKVHTDTYMKSPQILEEIFYKFGYNKIENFHASDETIDLRKILITPIIIRD